MADARIPFAAAGSCQDVSAEVVEPLARLRDDLRSVRLELEVPGADAARQRPRRLVAQVDDYLLPRLGRWRRRS